MPISYAVKHVLRSWKLFLALLIGIILASAFFSGIDVKANLTAKQSLDQQLNSVYWDMQASVSNLNLTQMLAVQNKVLDTTGVADAEIISRVSGLSIKIAGKNKSYDYFVRIAAIADNSRVYDGWLNKPLDGIGENETYIPEKTQLASELEIDDVIQMNFSIYDRYYGRRIDVPLNLTVKGFAQLNDKASAIASGYQWLTPFPGITTPPEIDVDFLMLIGWEKTIQNILNEMDKLNPSYIPLETSVLIFLNREALINPWDIGTSVNNIAVIKNSIENKLAADKLYVDVQDNLQWPLQSFQFVSMAIRFSFTIVSLPIFFMAWYMGTTVSDVSFNMRRREIGLLLTKGFSRGQILRTFLIETLLIGWIGGILGVFLGVLLIPIFTQFSVDALFSPYLISPYTMLFTVIFGIIMALLSTFSSAKKASQLATVDALREYLPMETEKPYKKRRHWVALILGTYKIAVFILGINMTEALSRIIFAGGGNFFIVLLVGIFMFIDIILNYIGPLLFFWGFTKLFIQGSLEFQALMTRIAKFLGDLGVLATKNVRRNPARSAAIAFLIALIVGYSVQVTGQLASEQDYAVRRIYYQVGADIAVTVPNTNETSHIPNIIIANVSADIQNATIQYTTWASTVIGSITLKAVEPNSWLKTAYYEAEWFSGNDVTTAYNNMASDNYTIILERNIAASLNLEVGGSIQLTFGSIDKTLRVVGFFGPEPSQQSIGVDGYRFLASYWSYIPVGLYENVSREVGGSKVLLLKLKGGGDGKRVAENIRALNLSQSYVESFAEKWEETQTNVITMGTLDVQRLGIVFAFLAASVGTALISAVSMRERSREATIMSVKGLSYKQLVIMFLTENLAIVVFSVILGVFVGIVIVYGNISSSNAMIAELVKRRLTFPLDSALMLTSFLTLIFAATILPILLMSRRYVTRLERMVRLR